MRTNHETIDWMDREMEVTVYWSPAEPMTKTYPGCDACIEIGEVVDVKTGRVMSDRWHDAHEKEIIQMLKDREDE